MALIFGSKIHVHEEISEDTKTELALKDLSKTAPAALEEAAAAAAAMEEQKMILERLEKRRDDLREQVHSIQYSSMPYVKPFLGSSGPANSLSDADRSARLASSRDDRQQLLSHSQRQDSRRKGRKRQRGAEKDVQESLTKPGGRSVANARMNMLPVLTTNAEDPFSVGLNPPLPIVTLGAAGTQAPPWNPPPVTAQGARAPRVMPVFMLPAVPPDARFVRRIPREDKPEELAARDAEASELLRMKSALGLSDAELEELASAFLT